METRGLRQDCSMTVEGATEKTMFTDRRVPLTRPVT